jgi:hypothetical protein
LSKEETELHENGKDKMPPPSASVKFEDILPGILLGGLAGLIFGELCFKHPGCGLVAGAVAGAIINVIMLSARVESYLTECYMQAKLPVCRTGNCHARDYVKIGQVRNGFESYRCKCGMKYDLITDWGTGDNTISTRLYEVSADGQRKPFMVREYSVFSVLGFTWKHDRQSD